MNGFQQVQCYLLTSSPFVGSIKLYTYTTILGMIYQDLEFIVIYQFSIL